MKKATILEKHMITKHQEHPCKQCDMKLKTFMDLLQHVAQYHLKEGDVNPEDDAKLKKHDEKEQGDQDESKTGFKIKKSVMDECIQ